MQADTLDTKARLAMKRRRLLVELETAGEDPLLLERLDLVELEDHLAKTMRSLMAAPVGGR